MTEFGGVMATSVTRRPGITVVQTLVSTPSAMTQPSLRSRVSTSDPRFSTCTVPLLRFLTAEQKNAAERDIPANHGVAEEAHV